MTGPVIFKQILSSTVTTRSNVIRYHINNYRNWSRISIRWWFHKRPPYLPLTGSYGVSFVNTWPRYNGPHCTIKLLKLQLTYISIDNESHKCTAQYEDYLFQRWGFSLFCYTVIRVTIIRENNLQVRRISHCFRFTIISDVYRFYIPNKTTFIKYGLTQSLQSKAVPDKFRRSGGHSKCNWLQDRAKS